MRLENAKITMLFSEDGLRIELRDGDANITFARVTLNPAKACHAMSRLCNVECECEVVGLDLVGKHMVHKPLEFEIGNVEYKNRKDTAILLASEKCPDGWVPDLYFGSQDSFFVKDGVNMARCTIRRWEA